MRPLRPGRRCLLSGLALLWAGCASVAPSLPTATPSLSDSVAYLADPRMRGRNEGREGSRLARAFLKRELERCGLLPAGTDGYEQPIQAGRGTNVLGLVPGRDPSADGTVLLSAHYDHQSGTWRTHPGAADNATSVAIVLRNACQLAANPPAHDVLIAFWDAEEPPTFLTKAMGSAWWAAHPTVPDVRVALVLDLMGTGLWPGYAGHFTFGLESSPGLRALQATVAVPEDLQPHFASLSLVEDLVTGQHATWSDYDAFRNQHLPYLFFTDGQNKRYHTPKDTVDAIDFDKLVAESTWVGAWTRAIADSATLPTWGPRWPQARDRAAVNAVIHDFLRDEPLGPKVSAAVAMGLQDPSPRRAAQRLMCYAGSQTPRLVCGLL